MGARGTAILNFGVFPGSNVAMVDAVATGVTTSSGIEAWIRPEATADHTDTDHVAAPMRVVGTYLSDDNIRIYGINDNDVIPPLEMQPPTVVATSARRKEVLTPQNSPMFVGQFNVNWVWV